MSDDHDGCEWVNVSCPRQKAVKRLCVCVCLFLLNQPSSKSAIKNQRLVGQDIFAEWMTAPVTYIRRLP